MPYGDWDRQIEFLIKRVEELEQEIDSLKKEINNKTIENNLYNTSSTISQNTIDIDMDRDYGQQSF
jgi:prefoldin subunit 5